MCTADVNSEWQYSRHFKTRSQVTFLTSSAHMARSYIYELTLDQVKELIRSWLWACIYFSYTVNQFFIISNCVERWYIQLKKKEKNKGNVNLSTNWCNVIYNNAVQHLKGPTFIRTFCPCRMLSCILKCCLFEMSSYMNSKRATDKDFLAAASSVKYGMWCL